MQVLRTISTEAFLAEARSHTATERSAKVIPIMAISAITTEDDKILLRNIRHGYKLPMLPYEVSEDATNITANLVVETMQLVDVAIDGFNLCVEFMNAYRYSPPRRKQLVGGFALEFDIPSRDVIPRFGSLEWHDLDSVIVDQFGSNRTNPSNIELTDIPESADVLSRYIELYTEIA